MYYLIDSRKTEESLRRLKKGKRGQFSLFNSPTPGKSEEGRDEEHIRLQMILDVEAFRKEAESLGVKPDKYAAFKSLHDLVNAAEGVWNLSTFCLPLLTSFMCQPLTIRSLCI